MRKYKNNTTVENQPVDEKRRRLITALLALGFSGPALNGLLQASTNTIIRKNIPSSGEKLAAIGLGTSRTFDALYDKELMQQLITVMQTFFDHQGTLIDSSPMYDSAEAVIGKLLKEVEGNKKLFAATKVWTDGRENGIEQMEASRKLWGIKTFDLMQIHNLRDWRAHLPTIKKMKAEGKLRYIGVTTSHGRYHAELAELLKTQPFDFVQLSYNIANRDVERELLPIAQDKGIAVIVNRPYQRGNLFHHVRGHALPDWSSEIDINSWGQYFLKFVISHPTVTCAIPATTKVKHMTDNMGAQYGRLPDQKMRKEMINYLKQLK